MQVEVGRGRPHIMTSCIMRMVIDVGTSHKAYADPAKYIVSCSAVARLVKLHLLEFPSSKNHRYV
jgi:hypothetical protein